MHRKAITITLILIALFSIQLMRISKLQKANRVLEGRVSGLYKTLQESEKRAMDLQQLNSKFYWENMNLYSQIRKSKETGIIVLPEPLPGLTGIDAIREEGE